MTAVTYRWRAVDRLQWAPIPKPLPKPLVERRGHLFRWSWNKILLIVASFVLVYICVRFVAGFYYLLLEQTYHGYSLTAAWHSAVSNATERHWDRNEFEGFVASLGVQFIVWNHYAVKAMFKPLNWFDKLENFLGIPNIKFADPLHWWQLALSPFIAMLYGYLPYEAALHAVLWLDAHPYHIPTRIIPAGIVHIVSKIGSKEAVGVAASFLARRPMRKVWDYAQLWAAERAASRVHNRWWRRMFWTPTFKARVNETLASGKPRRAVLAHHSWKQSVVMLGGLTVFLAVAAWGGYVLQVIAKRGAA